jgi:hypothetical protein
MPEDELEKLRLSLVHAYDKRKPLTRRLIEAMKRTRAPKKSIRRDSGKKVRDGGVGAHIFDDAGPS